MVGRALVLMMQKINHRPSGFSLLHHSASANGFKRLFGELIHGEPWFFKISSIIQKMRLDIF
jgi:hypothetical protein